MHRARSALARSVAVVLVTSALVGCSGADRENDRDRDHRRGHDDAPRRFGLREALDYLPADTVRLEFVGRRAVAERLGVADIDPREASDEDLEAYQEAAARDDATLRTRLTSRDHALRDAPFNEFDVRWEAWAFWDPKGPDNAGSATVWKVGDELDFDALTDELVDLGYDDQGGTYHGDGVESAFPQSMTYVTFDRDRRLVIGTLNDPGHLDDVTAVLGGDAPALVERRRVRSLVSLADGGPELAVIGATEDVICNAAQAPRLRPRARARYEDLGRPSARAFFVSGDVPQAMIVLRYPTTAAAEADLAARQDLVEHGRDPASRTPFAELGVFDLELDGDTLFIHEDYADGVRGAAAASDVGSGPGFCLPADDR